MSARMLLESGGVAAGRCYEELFMKAKGLMMASELHLVEIVDSLANRQ